MDVGSVFVASVYAAHIVRLVSRVGDLSSKFL